MWDHLFARILEFALVVITKVYIRDVPSVSEETKQLIDRMPMGCCRAKVMGEEARRILLNMAEEDED